MIETEATRLTRRRARSVQATLEWLSADRGGRKTPPCNSTYRSVSRFATDPNGSLGFWDVDIVFQRLPTPKTKKTAVTMSFVSSKAPQRLLRSGMRFQLTEGAKVVALGEVLSLWLDYREARGGFVPAVLIGAGLPNARHLHILRTYTEERRYLDSEVLNADKTREAVDWFFVSHHDYAGCCGREPRISGAPRVDRMLLMVPCRCHEFVENPPLLAP